MILKRRRCPHCGEAYRRREDLMHHIQTYHGSDGYDCRACGVSFPSMEEMRGHIQKKHSIRRL